MELKRLSEHIWYMPFETERDRPNLGYVKGDNWSLAIDAGHSAAHTKEFYALLKKEDLPLPSLTVLTHWHWDHTFGMHAVNGLCLANAKTNEYLSQWKTKIEKNGPSEFFAMHESIRREYSGGSEVIVVKADMIFSGEITLDLGGCIVKAIQTEAPHTDDSTVVYIENDKSLFLGDSTCDDFVTGVKRADLCEILSDTIRKINPEICVEGHWTPENTQDTLKDMLNGISG
ncbi:MBL fold metallo-hydrolase [Butyrivibrio sp. AD3002]|uniref:MBL fold metallo-hydrolase n=1 Tax=Butyrivibrio sp. AD3002 TaxID=1280670 RepID=UPI0003B5B58D|nr:MBL fold metallo-hydrolase [Butyrivibrio sp. AD3002]